MWRRDHSLNSITKSSWRSRPVKQNTSHALTAHGNPLATVAIHRTGLKPSTRHSAILRQPRNRSIYRANFSVVRGAPFFADFDWQKVTFTDLFASCLSDRSANGEPPRYSIDSDPYSEFTRLNPSMIVEQATPDVGGADRSDESAIAKYHTLSHLDTSSSGQSPVSCGSFQFFNSFSLSPLFHDSSCHLESDNHVLRSLVRSLDEGEDPIFSLPAAWIAVFGDSGTCLCQGTAVAPAGEDDKALLRTSIRSLDIGEGHVFVLPSGWKEAFVSSPDVIAPCLSQSEGTKKTSVLPKLKSLWNRATSKFSLRRV